MIFYIIIGITVLLLIFIMIEINYYNKFQILKIKISEAYNSMDILFEKKVNLLERATNIIKENNDKYKEDMLLDNLTKIKSKNIDRFELNHELTLAFRDYKGLLDLDQKLANLDSLKSINEELVNIDTDLDASKKYYNDNVVLFNNLVKCFPSNLLAVIKKYKKKDFFKEEKIETLEILKEQEKKKEEEKKQEAE